MDKLYDIRNLNKEDYESYLNIMFEFTNYKYNLSKEKFDKFIDNIDNNNQKIIVIIYNKELIGAGTIFKLIKLHNNPVGQIEDVIISNKYRGKGLGKLIIQKLIEIGLNDFKCYKIILNCLNKNIDFYKKCGFEEVGIEMKLNKNIDFYKKCGFEEVNNNEMKLNKKINYIYRKVINRKVINKIQIYISNNFSNFSKYYMPFLLYREIIYSICKKYLTNNIEYIYNIKNFDDNENTILIMNIYCLSYTKEYNIFEIIKNSKSNIILINTEYYQNHNINNLMNIISKNNLNFFIMEYNIINYHFFKKNYENINLHFLPLIYDSYLETYYKNNIDNNFISWKNKDIDVLFVGRINDRRLNVINKINEKYKVHTITNYSGEIENKNICNYYERSKITINIFYENENSIFDYYRNTFLISNKILLLFEKPKNVDFSVENYLNNYEDILFTCEYDDFFSTIDNILTNYNEDKINEIKEKQYSWFKGKDDINYYKSFFLNNFC